MRPKKTAHQRSLARLELLVGLSDHMRKSKLGSTTSGVATAVARFQYEDEMGVIGGFVPHVAMAMRKAGLR